MEPGLASSSIQRSSINTLEEVQPPFPVHLGVGVQVSPIATDGLMVIAQSDRTVVLLSEHTGKRLGALTLPSAISVTPALRSGTLFVAGDDRLYAYDLANFLDQPSLQQLEPVWSYECENGSITRPLLIDEAAIYPFSRNSQQVVLHAVSQANGAQLWPVALVLDTNQIAPPLLVNNQLVLITSDGQVTIVETTTGEIKQKFLLNARVDLQATPFVVDNRVFLSDPSGQIIELVLDRAGPLINLLYHHRARVSSIAASRQFIALGHTSGLTLLSSRGNLQWTSDTLESISATPIIAGDSIFALDDSGNGLLFEALKSNPVVRVKLLSGEVGMSPLMTQSRIVVVGADGKVVALDWH
ncbi:MAG TPA: PQQ-binding-like beta-propeller repeat protein [Pyrinomonadaceae bacterium]|nr:PQQ-binding-like beta-propeller repeat protein [Pyrinomonadaceae bacterium]